MISNINENNFYGTFTLAPLKIEIENEFDTKFFVINTPLLIPTETKANIYQE
jgi:hypothetical protein